MSCPDKSILSKFASGDADDETLSILESHLDECSDCRSALDQLLDAAPESEALGEIRDWEKEQEHLRPTLTALLASSFRVSEKLDPTAFSFINDGDAEHPKGRLGDMVIDGLIGCGAMGAVFRAHDEKLERDVAIKVLRPEYGESEEIRQLFLDEARSMAAVHHENVLPIHDVARDEASEPYFVMPLIEGGRLRDRIDRDGKLDPDSAVSIATNVALALSAVHDAGVLHRDIKPTNVLLDDVDALDRIWLADFGLSCVDAHGFGEGSLVGTKGYVAPEIEAGKSGTVASDLYSFGAMLHEMLTGWCPDSSVDNEAVPAWLCPLLGELLSPDPKSRPQSAAEVATRIEKGWKAARDRSESAKQRRKKTTLIRRAASFFLLGLILLLMLDAATGWVRSSSVLRKILDKPVSVDGRLMPFPALSEALSSSDGDLTIRLSGGVTYTLDGRITSENRHLRLIGAGPEQARLIAKTAGRNGIVSITNGSIDLQSLDIRFRAVGRIPVDSLFAIETGSLSLRDVSIKRINSGGTAPRGLRIFSLRGSSTLEIDNAIVLTESSTVGILSIVSPGEAQTVSVHRLRFTGQIFCITGSEEKSPPSKRGIVDLSVSHSTLLTASPFRAGRGHYATELRVESRENIWQGSGPFLISTVAEKKELAEAFSFTDSGSVASGGGSEAVKTKTGSNTPARSVFSKADVGGFTEDWNAFRQLAPERISSLNWVEWIVTYRPGSPPKWNGDMEWKERGRISKEGNFENIR